MAKRPLDLVISVEPKGSRWAWKLAEQGSKPVKTGTASTEDDAFGNAMGSRGRGGGHPMTRKRPADGRQRFIALAEQGAAALVTASALFYIGHEYLGFARSEMREHALIGIMFCVMALGVLSIGKVKP